MFKIERLKAQGETMKSLLVSRAITARKMFRSHVTSANLTMVAKWLVRGCLSLCKRRRYSLFLLHSTSTGGRNKTRTARAKLTKLCTLFMLVLVALCLTLVTSPWLCDLRPTRLQSCRFTLNVSLVRPSHAVLSPYTAPEECVQFECVGHMMQDLSTPYTSFYPAHKAMFLDATLSSQICDNDTDIRLFMAITTRPKSFDKRAAVRHTFASLDACNERLFARYNLTCAQVWNRTRFAFFTGLDQSVELNRKVAKESLAKRDLVRLNKRERYDDLSVKTFALFHWASEFCAQAQYVMKVDDDSIVNLGSVFELLASLDAQQHEHFIVGHVQPDVGLDRDPNSTYYTPRSVLPHDKAPPYAFGCGYLMPARTADLLYRAGRCVASISIEDLFITGLLRDSLNVSVISEPCINCYQLSAEQALEQFEFIKILHHVRASTMRHIWTQLQRQYDDNYNYNYNNTALLAMRAAQRSQQGSNYTTCSWPIVLTKDLINTNT